MEGNRAQSKTDGAERRFKEQLHDDMETTDATLAHRGALEVSTDEDDPGGDPYNHTGRFKKNVR